MFRPTTGRTGRLERKRKANTLCLTIFALSRFEEQGLVPLFRVYGFEVDESVKFKNRPFIGRFGVKFCKLDLSCIGTHG